MTAARVRCAGTSFVSAGSIKQHIPACGWEGQIELTTQEREDLEAAVNTDSPDLRCPDCGGVIKVERVDPDFVDEVIAERAKTNPAFPSMVERADPKVERCPFCNYAGPVLEVYGDALIIEPLNPVVAGHVLVIPKKHVPDALTSPALTGLVMEYAARYASQHAGTCNIITSAGPEATQTVFHLHVHIVPRHAGDGLRLPWTEGDLMNPKVEQTPGPNWGDEEPRPLLDRVPWRIGVLDKDLVEDPDAIVDNASWIAGWYVLDCAELLERLQPTAGPPDLDSDGPFFTTNLHQAIQAATAALIWQRGRGIPDPKDAARIAVEAAWRTLTQPLADLQRDLDYATGPDTWDVEQAAELDRLAAFEVAILDALKRRDHSKIVGEVRKAVAALERSRERDDDRS